MENIELNNKNENISISAEIPNINISTNNNINLNNVPKEVNLEVLKTVSSGGKVQDVLVNGESVVNELGNAIIEIPKNSMTEIEVSSNIENPTDISPYFEKSGTYVAKSYGIIGFGDFLTPIAKGGYFTVQNFRDDASRFGVEVSDEDNVIMVSVFYYDGGTFEEVMLKKIGTEDWYAGVKITSLNAQDYLDLDIDVTSEVQQVLRNAVNNSYGMQLIGNYLSFISANNSDIDLANTQYRVITPGNIKYAIEKWGKEYYATKEQAETLQTNINNVENKVDNLKSEIETILESVVVIDE